MLKQNCKHVQANSSSPLSPLSCLLSPFLSSPLLSPVSSLLSPVSSLLSSPFLSSLLSPLSCLLSPVSSLLSPLSFPLLSPLSSLLSPLSSLLSPVSSLLSSPLSSLLSPLSFPLLSSPLLSSPLLSFPLLWTWHQAKEECAHTGLHTEKTLRTAAKHSWQTRLIENLSERNTQAIIGCLLVS